MSELLVCFPFALALFFRHTLKPLANKANAAAKPELFGIYSQGHEKPLTLERVRIIHRARLSKKTPNDGKLSPSYSFSYPLIKQTWGLPSNKSAEVTYSLKPHFKMQFRHVGAVVPMTPGFAEPPPQRVLLGDSSGGSQCKRVCSPYAVCR